MLAIPVEKLTEVAHSDDPVTWFTPGGRTMARSALRRVGCGRANVVGHFSHALQKAVVNVLPASVYASVVFPVMKAHKEKEERKQA